MEHKTDNSDALCPEDPQDCTLLGSSFCLTDCQAEHEFQASIRYEADKAKTDY